MSYFYPGETLEAITVSHSIAINMNYFSKVASEEIVIRSSPFITSAIFIPASI